MILGDGRTQVRQGPGVAELEGVEGVEEMDGLVVSVLVAVIRNNVCTTRKNVAWIGQVYKTVGHCVKHTFVDTSTPGLVARPRRGRDIDLPPSRAGEDQRLYKSRSNGFPASYLLVLYRGDTPRARVADRCAG